MPPGKTGEETLRELREALQTAHHNRALARDLGVGRQHEPGARVAGFPRASPDIHCLSARSTA